MKNFFSYLLIILFYFQIFKTNGIPPVPTKRTFVDNFFEDRFKFGFNLVSQIPLFPPPLGSLNLGKYTSYAFGFDLFVEYRYRSNRIGTRINFCYLASPGKPKNYDTYKHMITIDPQLKLYPGKNRNFFIAQGIYFAIPVKIIGTKEDKFGDMAKYAFGILLGLGGETKKGICIGFNFKIISFNKFFPKFYLSKIPFKKYGTRFMSNEFYIGWNLGKIFTY